MATDTRERMLEEWARYLNDAARKGAFTKKPTTFPMHGIVGVFDKLKEGQ